MRFCRMKNIDELFKVFVYKIEYLQIILKICMFSLETIFFLTKKNCSFLAALNCLQSVFETSHSNNFLQTFYDSKFVFSSFL